MAYNTLLSLLPIMPPAALRVAAPDALTAAEDVPVIVLVVSGSMVEPAMPPAEALSLPTADTLPPTTVVPAANVVVVMPPATPPTMAF